MRVKQLIKSINLRLPENIDDFQVKGITSDSRKTGKDFVFAAVKGNSLDGHCFIQQAIGRGAKLVIGTDDLNPEVLGEVVYIKVVDSRILFAKLAACFYGYPSDNMKVVGITGTNGKTTVTYLIEAILKSADFNPAVVGTINYRFRDKVFCANNTTPGAGQLQGLLHQMQAEGIDYAVLEVSSHALDQDRTGAINFSTAIFTNLSVDHLDYHQNIDKYFAAKTKLFSGLSDKSLAVINIDDSRGPELIKSTGARVITYGLAKHAGVRAGNIRLDIKGVEFSLNLGPGIPQDISNSLQSKRLSVPLVGEYNVYNVLGAVAFALAEGIDFKFIKKALEEFKGIPGRLEKVSGKEGFAVFVDYAHTEDALKNVMRSLRPLCKGRLRLLFGCGGNRDKSKRPKMGRVATELADDVIITSDNPRDEEAQAIIDDITRGIGKDNFRIITDRRQAIKEILSLAKKDDIILVAGKGHETYQVLKHRTIDFDDRKVIREFLPE